MATELSINPKTNDLVGELESCETPWTGSRTGLSCWDRYTGSRDAIAEENYRERGVCIARRQARLKEVNPSYSAGLEEFELTDAYTRPIRAPAPCASGSEVPAQTVDGLIPRCGTRPQRDPNASSTAFGNFFCRPWPTRRDARCVRYDDFAVAILGCARFTISSRLICLRA